MNEWMFLTAPFSACSLKTGVQRVTEGHVAGVYPCWDAGSQILAPHSDPNVSLCLSLSCRHEQTVAPSDWAGTHGCVNFVWAPLATVKFASVPLHIDASWAFCPYEKQFVCPDIYVSCRAKGCDVVPLSTDLIKSPVCLLTGSKGQRVRY